ncbi:MAG: ribonuclease P protein component [Porticoccus sp.]|jgi:ribonuclease P protein component|nr:ribonuclease P protein component [Porticoccus sp.]|tara:strand:+ start:985 stop:1350 length:366 start_codon:yes stop_codon:yes gene_type:complete
MSNYNFGRKNRLLNSHSFQRVFDNTKFKVSNSCFLLLANQNQLNHPRLGMIVAKKSIRFSVNRNRLKRVIRSSFRVNQQNLSSLDIIFLVRKGMNKLSFREQTELVTKGLDQLHKKLQNIS